jgi:lipopolysaccharide transport system permease protein
MPFLHVVDGRDVVTGNPGALTRAGRFLAEPFTSAWRHRDLIVAVLRRELRERFKGSVAGWVWALFAPLLSLVTYTLVFNGVVSLPNKLAANSPVDYGLYIFGGLLAFQLFSEMAYRAPSLLHEYSHYIKQTMFPAEVLPIISTLRATTYAIISISLMLLCQLAFAGFLNWTVLLLVPWLLMFVAFLVGMTWFLSALGAFTRDISYLMTTILPVLMFATPVFFSHEMFSPRLKLLMYANPLTGFIEIVRDIVVIGNLPRWTTTAWTVALSVAMFWVGYWVFRKYRDRIADVI